MRPTFTAIAGPLAGQAQHQVLVALRDGGPASRAQLARRSGLAPPTITGAVRRLLDQGLLLEGGPAIEDEGVVRSGPRGTSVGLNPDLAYVVGVDVGFQKTRVAVCDASGRERGHAQAPFGLDRTPAEEGLTLLKALVEEAASGLDPTRLVGAGVALRGPVDNRAQRVSVTGEAGEWAGLSAKQVVDRLGMPVHLENDANLAALGEAVFGAGRGADCSLTVKLHSGIGLGVIAGGRLVTGLRGGVGEIGHVNVDPRGALCRCGKRGCLDTVAAIPAILAAGSPRFDTLDQLLAAVAEGELGAARLVRDAATEVGRVLATASLLLAPERVVVVGALARAREGVLAPIRLALEQEAIPHLDHEPSVVLGELDDHATVLGAAALALHEAGWMAAPGRGALLA